MSVTPRQSKLIKERLEKHWETAPRCPLCENSKWLIGSIHELKDYHNGDLVIGGPITPVLSLVCDKCGGTQFVNALIFGIVDKAGKVIGMEPSASLDGEIGLGGPGVLGCAGSFLDRLASLLWPW